MNVKLIGKHEKDSRTCRDALSLTLNELMAKAPSICYIDCDLMGCVNTEMLRKNYPDWAFEAASPRATPPVWLRALPPRARKCSCTPLAPLPPGEFMTRST